MRQVAKILTLVVGLVLVGCEGGRIWRASDYPEFPSAVAKIYLQSEIAGKIRPLDRPVTIGGKTPRRIRARGTTEVTFLNDRGSWEFWHAVRTATRVDGDGDVLVQTTTVEDSSSGGIENIAPAFRDLKGVSYRFVFDKDAKLLDVTVKGGQFPDSETVEAQYGEAEQMLWNFWGPLSRRGIRGKTIDQEDALTDLSAMAGEAGGDYPPIKDQVRGETTYLGRRALFATVDYEDITTRLSISGYGVTDLETGSILESAIFLVAPLAGGLTLESLTTYATIEFDQRSPQTGRAPNAPITKSGMEGAKR